MPVNGTELTCGCGNERRREGGGGVFSETFRKISDRVEFTYRV